MLVALVEVRHGRHEPTVHGLVEVYLRSIGVEHRCELVACLQILGVGCLLAVHGLCLYRVFLVLGVEPFGCVEPVFRWHVLDPRVLKATVVEDHVHDHLETFLVSLVDQTAVVGV